MGKPEARSPQAGAPRRLKLTKSAIDIRCLPDEDGKQLIYWDTELRGFGLRVGKGRVDPSKGQRVPTKTYIAQRDVGGRTTRVKIGRHGSPWTPDLARKKARELLVEMDQGINPNERRQGDAAALLTVREAMELYLSKLRAQEASPSTARGVVYETERYLGDWLGKPLASLTGSQCRRRHERISEKNGKTTANRALANLRTIYRNARREHPTLPVEAPTAAVNWNKTRRRRDRIAWEDLPGWYAKVQTLAPVRRDYQLFVLLTGLRATDAKTARWEDVDLEAATIHRPKPKGGMDRAFTIPLSRRTVEVLRARREENAVEFGPLGGDEGWVFPAVVRRDGRKVVTHMQNHSQQKYVGGRKVAALAGPHTLRRTYASVASEEVEIPFVTLKLLLNHTLPANPGDVTAGYISPSMDRLREAQERISAFLIERMKR